MAGIVDRFQPLVRSYDQGGYLLAHDLDSLWRAREAGIREATVFYSARALEALSAAALEMMGLKGKENAFANLSRLEEYGLLPQHTRYWAHALRRAGNAVRHAGSRTTAAEEETTCAFLEYWLRWYFCDFVCGPRLPDLAAEGHAAPLIQDESLSRCLSLLAAENLDPGQAAREVTEGPSDKARQVPALLAVLAERFVEMNRLDEAKALLDRAVAQHGGDLRLRQLQGLCCSRAGRLDEAVEILEPLYRQYRTDDEMIGIMAGVYKRKWRADPDDRRWLSRSHKAYFSGWKQDRENTYLGINAATTALFMGKETDVQTISAQVRHVLESRAKVLAALPGEAQAPPGLWDRLTLVEAQLLGGCFDAATQEFAAAARSHPDAAGSLAVARQQFLEIAERMGAPAGMFDETAKG